jgi:cytidine deaminase
MLGQLIVQKVHTSMAQLFKSASTIPESGIYRVIHAQHRLPHEVTLIGGQVFPPCGKCREEVRFELVRELPELERERRGHVSLYSLPVLEDEDEPPR